MSRIARKVLLMFGALALLIGIGWMLQGKDMLGESFSNDARLFDRGIILAVAGIAAIIAARRVRA